MMMKSIVKIVVLKNMVNKKSLKKVLTYVVINTIYIL
jgi:hypothetical protein